MGVPNGEEPDMTKFLMLSKYGGADGLEPMANWDPEDIKGHLGFLRAMNLELTDRVSSSTPRDRPLTPVGS